MQQQKLLFEDKDIRITTQYLTIKCYYFPIGTSKKIPLKDIARVEIRDLGMARMRLWGMDAMAWGYWLPGDCQRCSRDQFIAVYTNKCIVPSFTTEHTTVVYNILSSELQKLRNYAQTNQNSPIYIQPTYPVDQRNEIVQPIMKS